MLFSKKKAGNAACASLALAFSADAGADRLCFLRLKDLTMM